MPGVCNCTIGPGPHGCAACGAPGWQWSPPAVPVAPPQPVIITLPARITREDADTIREIVREELECLEARPDDCPSFYDPAPDRERVLCLRSKGHKGAHVGVDNGFQVQWS